MSFQIGLFVLCLARLSLGEPPVAPYPPAGPPSGPGFPQIPGGSTNQFQDLPEIIAARSGNLNEQPNHRIHFNLFKDHETKKNRDNISFKLGQGLGQGQFKNGGDQNFGRNNQGAQENRYSNQARSGPSQRYGAPQNSALSQNYPTPNFNQQSNQFGLHQQLQPNQFGHQGHEISSRYGAPNQNSGPSSRYGAPNQGFDQRQDSQYDQQTNFRTSAGYDQQQGVSQRHQQPQSQYGSPQGLNANSYTTSNRLSDTYGPPQSSGLSGRSNQQPSSTYGTPGFQQSSYPFPASGAPPQGRQGQNQYKIMSQYQQRSQNNQQDRFNDLQRQGGSYQNNADARSSEDMTEKANYEFEYEVRGDQSHGHEESREGDETWGSYKVQLPDGRTMLVEYTADDRGYRPKITYSDQSEEQPY